MIQVTPQMRIRVTPGVRFEKINRHIVGSVGRPVRNACQCSGARIPSHIRQFTGLLQDMAIGGNHLWNTTLFVQSQQAHTRRGTVKRSSLETSPWRLSFQKS